MMVVEISIELNYPRKFLKKKVKNPMMDAAMVFCGIFDWRCVQCVLNPSPMQLLEGSSWDLFGLLIESIEAADDSQKMQPNPKPGFS